MTATAQHLTCNGVVVHRTSPGISDAELKASELARTGSRVGFEWLLRQHSDSAFAFLVRYLGDRAAAEDVFQEATLRAYKSIHRFRKGVPFRPWFFRIAINRAKSYIKVRDRMRKSQWTENLCATSSAGAQVGAKSTLEQALTRIKASDRQIILLRFVEELSMAEISQVLGVPEFAANMRLSRARRRFRETVAALEQEGRK